jgi:hypothetical protein
MEILAAFLTNSPLFVKLNNFRYGKFNHYTNNKVDQIDNCTKDTTTHLNRLQSIDVSSANFPEGLSCVVKSQYSLDRVGVIPLSAFPLLPTGCPLN